MLVDHTKGLGTALALLLEFNDADELNGMIWFWNPHIPPSMAYRVFGHNSSTQQTFGIGGLLDIITMVAFGRLCRDIGQWPRHITEERTCFLLP
jgi:hypothetical protein